MSKKKKKTIPQENTAEATPKKKKSGIKDFLMTLLVAFIIAMLLRTFVVVSCSVLSRSMVPTLTISDHVIAFRLAYSFGAEPERGDIIIFEPPAEVDEGVDFIKRVIGEPGDTVEVKEGYVWINGQALQEDYIAEKPDYEFGPVTVPAGEYLVLGDNRNRSLDSHLWSYSFIEREDIDGQVLFQYYPFNEIRTFPYTEQYVDTQ